ncbi:MAG: M56 family metallopeptidase [Lachnospiraceae bacterium]|nr:M56 family metallopeptidase [Lachnospiraceae bacterium]
MRLYATVSYVLLRRKVMTAVRHVDNIYFSEFVSSPFLLGIIRPRIYLPYGIGEKEREFVIAHEKAHIARRDHWWKPLGFILLAVYWFNPLIWAAYILLCRDIESACDEKVVSEMGTDERRSYSNALLNASLGIKRRRIAACPLAFGETGVKNRIKNVMNYKKPVFWIIAAAIVGCIVLAVCFLTDPAQKKSAASDGKGQEQAEINGGEAALGSADGNGQAGLNGSETATDPANGSGSHKNGDGAEALTSDGLTGGQGGITKSESILSDNIYNAIQEDWDRWDEKDEFSKMISSSLPGAGSKYFETWQEAVDYLGVEPWNPLEDADWLKIMNYTGADIKDMFDPEMLPHCSLTWYGTRDNKLTYAEFTTGYAVDDVRVTLKIDLHNASENANLQSGNLQSDNSQSGNLQSENLQSGNLQSEKPQAGESQSGSNRNNNGGPSGIRLSETYHERATAKQAEFRHVNEDGYYFYYTLRCVNLETGEDALAKATEVMNRVLEYMGMGGIPTTPVDMMGPGKLPDRAFAEPTPAGISPDVSGTSTETVILPFETWLLQKPEYESANQIPGTDANAETDYFIDIGNNSETDELMIKYKNEAQGIYENEDTKALYEEYVMSQLFEAYKDIDVSEGVQIVVWQFSPNSYSCVLLPKNSMISFDQINGIGLLSLTPDQAIEILELLNVSDKNAIIRGTYNPYSSYINLEPVSGDETYLNEVAAQFYNRFAVERGELVYNLQ